MAEARSRDAWQHTGGVIAALANTLGSGRRVVTPDDVNPWALADRKKAEDDPRVYMPIECLIAAWTQPHGRRNAPGAERR